MVRMKGNMLWAELGKVDYGEVGTGGGELWWNRGLLENGPAARGGRAPRKEDVDENEQKNFSKRTPIKDYIGSPIEPQ